MSSPRGRSGTPSPLPGKAHSSTRAPTRSPSRRSSCHTKGSSMTDRLKIFRMLMPGEFVLFDHNPETLRVTRELTDGGRSKPGNDTKQKASKTAGTLGAVYHGTDPMTVTIGKARLIGPECKIMVDNILGWLSPSSGMV